MPLTDTEVRKAKAQAEAYRLSDGGSHYLWVTPAGGKLWRWAYKHEGKRNEEISGYRSSTNERLGGDTLIEKNVGGNLRIADGSEADYVDQIAAISVRAWQSAIRK